MLTKNIIFLIRDIHYGGGGERVTVNLANWLKERNYAVTIVSIAVPGKENIFRINEGIKIDYLGIDFKSGFNIVNKIRSVFVVRNYFSKPNESLNAIDPMFIIIGIGTYPDVLLSFLPEHKKYIRIGTQHCSYSSLAWHWRKLGELFFHRLNALISLTERDVPKWKTMNARVRVISNAVSFFPEKVAPLENKIILWVGRIDYPKGYDLLLEVFKIFSTMEREWRLRIIGDGAGKHKLIKAIQESALKDCVEVLPATNHIQEEYQNASVYLMTSRTEGFPMVLLEAQASGLPVIAFDCETGPSEIVHHGVDGFLVEPFDKDKMVLYLRELCLAIETRRYFGRNARENARNYLPDNIGGLWENLFEELQN